LAERHGVASILLPLAVVQGLAVAAALLIHDAGARNGPLRDASDGIAKHSKPERSRGGWHPNDAGLWTFVAAMVLFHTANAPGGGVDDRPPGRPAPRGGGPGDRRLLARARLGDWTGGLRLPDRPARLSGPVRSAGGAGRSGDAGRRGVRARDPGRTSQGRRGRG